MPLREKRLLENIKSGNLCGYVQCDIEVTENLVEAFTNFPPIFNNINVDRDDIRPFMKEYAEKERLLTQPRRMLISNYFMEKRTVITNLLLFYLDLGLVCKKNYRFVQYTPRVAAAILFSLQWMLEKEDTRIHILVLWQRQWSY